MARKSTLKLLYTPSATANLDIIFVHGLGGDTTRTWTWQPQDDPTKRPVCWPQDLLPATRPLTRVFSFGYNADVHRNDSIADIRDHARTILERLTTRRDGVDPKRPIVFVAHCLGGLIVKQVLRFATSEKNKFGSIATATCGILLFGTPHFGADTEQVRTIAERFASLGQTAEKPTFAGLAKAIIANSNDLKEISEDFRTLASRYNITSWYETECWPGTNRPIVDATSARMQIPSERQIAVAADHLAMCQFMDKDDETFQEVCNSIQRAVETGYLGPNRGDNKLNSSGETTRVAARTAVVDTSNCDRGFQNVILLQETQAARSTHRTADSAKKARKIVFRTMEVEYEVPASMDGPIQMRGGTGRDALRREPVALLDDTDDARDRLPWTEETPVWIEETPMADKEAAAVKSMNREAESGGGLWRLLSRRSRKYRAGKAV